MLTLALTLQSLWQRLIHMLIYIFQIVDLDTEQPVTGPNKKGEVRLKTDHIMNGYYKMDSSDAFDSEGYFRTGDVAYYDEDNCLFLVDRVRNIFKYRGWHILPAILEAVLMEHPAVKEAAVIGIPHPDDEAHPMGLVVLKKGYEDATSEEIRKFADDKLSNAQKLRAGIKIVDKLIRTPTGKVKRKGLGEAIQYNNSGTTGLPKGICLNHYALLSQSGSFKKDAFDTNNSATVDTVVLLYPTLYWISRVCVLIGSIMRGEANVICRSFDAKRFLEIVEKYKVTLSFLPPYYFSDLLHEHPKNQDADVSSLKVLWTGSCPVIAKQLIEVMTAFPGTFVLNMYGQTELAGAIACITDPSDYDLQKKKPDTVGKILSQYKWKIVDLETEQPVTGPNKKGELRLKTDLHMNGYYKMDSTDAFDSDGYLRTGDLAYYDEDNCLYIDDRVKEMFKYRGWHILPAIVEEVLMGIPHPEDGDHAMGLVALKKGFETVTPEEILKFADERLSDAQKLRAGVKIFDELIRTATGKLKRRALKEMVLNHKQIES
nr:unnamed protein product [Callosobruchus chinensis]